MFFSLVQPSSIKPDWSSVTAIDLSFQTSVTELNIGLTSLVSSPILPSDHDLFLCNCTALLSDVSVTPTGLVNLFSASLFWASKPPLIDMFLTKSTRLSTLYYFVLLLTTNQGISNESTQWINCIASEVYTIWLWYKLLTPRLKYKSFTSKIQNVTNLRCVQNTSLI